MYDPRKVEKEMLEFWEKNKIFEKLAKKNKGKKKFRFIDGPITANNPMGVHHGYARTLKDLYQRYKAMQGFDERFQNGFDCHGLPIEVEVEKELGLKSKRDIEKYGINNFIEKCKERINKITKIQTKQSIRLGQWMDWKNSYYTMSDENILHIWYFLKKCYEKGWIYKGHKVLPWCPRCGTSLSQHEVSEGYKTLTHKTVFVKFPLIGKKNEYLLVWTTTPWTLSSNVAAAVNPDIMYIKAEKDGEIYYLSKKTSKVLGEHKVLEELKGSEMVGWKYNGPYDELEAQRGIEHVVVPWGDVGEEDGTGIVHIAPGCGEEDFELGKKLGLKAISPLDEYGNFIKGFGWLTGMYVKDVRDKIFEDLKKKKMLFKIGEITHRYPTCWRCKEELVFRMTDSWFIKVDEIRDKLIEEANNVFWSPGHGKKLMNDWLKNMGDWNISRRRYWGLPIPIWICEDCGEMTVIGSLEELKEKAISGMDNLKDLHKPQIDNVILKCPKCGGKMKRIPEVGDCWLDAGIVPFSTLKYLEDRNYWKEWFPAEFVSEMREQVRLWFYSMLFMSVVLENRAPYEKVLMFEKVYDEKGQEMHKSGKNVIWFDDAIEKIGADVMRWMYAKTNLTQNVLFGYNIGKEIRKNLDYLMNISKYIKTFMNGPPEKIGEDLEKEDRWILSRLESTKKVVYESLENLIPYAAARNLEKFFINDISRNYIKLVRDRIKEDKRVPNILYLIFLDTLKLMAPFTPFITEYIYQDLFRKFEGKESIHLFDWPAHDDEKIDTKIEDMFEVMMKIIETSNAIRQEEGIRLRHPVKEMIISGPEKLEEYVKYLEPLLKRVGNVKNVKFEKAKMNYEVKLNYPVVGPKYGKQVKDMEKALKNMNGEEIVNEIENNNFVKILDKKLKREDLVIRVSSPEEGKGFIVNEVSGVVFLDLEETPEIFEERLIKELIRNVQQARKDNKLTIEQKIKLILSSDESTEDVIKGWLEKIKKSTGAIEILFEEPFNGKLLRYKDRKIKFEIEVIK
ncbi:MAG: isoleucine--tRNA ligase [Candidatus Aenigmarchaeota archaeon]|nr:isoleucine--tRNA ligase [Candidatus Aenigmarchaeota archaeon]